MVDTMQPVSVPTDEDQDPRKAQAEQMRAEGYRPGEIRTRLKLSRHLYYRWFPAEGSRAEQVAQRAPKEQVQFLRDAGVPDTEISRQLGVSRTYIWNLVGPRGDTERRTIELTVDQWSSLGKQAVILGLPMVPDGDPVRDLLVMIAQGRYQVAVPAS